jgi:hypothetical protein
MVSEFGYRFQAPNETGVLRSVVSLVYANKVSDVSEALALLV